MGNSLNNSFDIAVIGGGPSGMIAAGRAAELGCRVVLFEKNAYTGKKLGITGKGRCNVTNCCEISELMKNINGEPKFLWSSFSSFSPSDTMAFFENLGVPLKVERGRRVFPVSDKAADIVSALRTYMRKNGVKVVYSPVTSILSAEQRITGVEADNSIFNVSSVIICTGGLSYPATGSTGDGYRWASEMGHAITELRPSLVELISDSAYGPECAGLSLKNCAIKLITDSKTVFEDFGELLFTHRGVSGPIVLSASAHMKSHQHYDLFIDLKPALSPEMLDARIMRDFSLMQNKTFKNSLSKLLPSSLRSVVVGLSGIDPEKEVNSITKNERSKLVTLLKAFPVLNVRPGPMESAIVTAGGISTSKINPKTLQSKLCDGLYFAGEILNVDGITGGYNLQIAFSTGWVSGSSAAQKILDN